MQRHCENMLARRARRSGGGPDYLCFTALADDSSVGMVKFNYSGDEYVEAPDVTLYTSADKVGWTPYVPGTTGGIQLAKAGDKVYWKGDNDTLITWGVDGSGYCGFSMSGSIAASGDVASLLDSACATEASCFAYLFRECASLVAGPRLKHRTIQGLDYLNLFSGCSSISRIYVSLTEWPPEGTVNWVSGVPAGGEFHCPAALDASTFDESHVPVGWTVVKDM